MRALLLKSFSHDSSTGHVLSMGEELNRQGYKSVVVLTGAPLRFSENYGQYVKVKYPLYTENEIDSIIKIARQYQVNLVHVHSLSLIPQAVELARRLNIPFGISTHEDPTFSGYRTMVQLASFVITPYPEHLDRLTLLNRNAAFIPEGVDLDLFKSADKADFKISFIKETDSNTEEGRLALLKAAGLANVFVNHIGKEQLPLVNGLHLGWLPHCAGVLSGSQIVAGRGRSLIEGMACGNVALVMGKSYYGILRPQKYSAHNYPELSGEGTIEPCYRAIFNDLSQLWKDPDYRETLQYWGRKFVRENCDLRLTVESTVRVYTRSRT